MNEETKVILKFGYDISLCISIKAAVEIVSVLSRENVLKNVSTYKDGKSGSKLEPWGTEDILIQFITPADYMLRIAAGEKVEE